jgi:hypothetical protein
MAKTVKRRKQLPDLLLPADFNLYEYFAEMGRMGGKKNSKKQQEHRRKKAVRAMLKAKFPADPRWK